MPSELITTLEKVNREVRNLLALIHENSTRTGRVIFPAGRLTSLSNKLTQTAQLIAMASPAAPTEPALHAALGEYQVNLLKLKAALATVQESLRKRHHQLHKNRAHLSSAHAWMDTLRQTK